MTSPAKHIYSSSMEFNKGKLVNICINKSLSNDYNSKNKVKTTCKKNNNINKDIKNEKYLLNKSTLGSTTRNNNSIKKFDKNFTLNNYKKTTKLINKHIKEFNQTYFNFSTKMFNKKHYKSRSELKNIEPFNINLNLYNIMSKNKNNIIKESNKDLCDKSTATSKILSTKLKNLKKNFITKNDISNFSNDNSRNYKLKKNSNSIKNNNKIKKNYLKKNYYNNINLTKFTYREFLINNINKTETLNNKITDDINLKKKIPSILDSFVNKSKDLNNISSIPQKINSKIYNSHFEELIEKKNIENIEEFHFNFVLLLQKNKNFYRNLYKQLNNKSEIEN
jgi:hypothetical protein